MMRMPISSSLLAFLSCAIAVRCASATVVVDGVTGRRDAAANIGDSIVFRHRYHYDLYIFRSRAAFDLCNFGQASLLTSPNSTAYTWHPSRPGFFYFSFYNGTSKPCHEGQKIAIKVTPHPSPAQNSAETPIPAPVVAAPPPIAGGAVSSSPAYPWPFQPRDRSSPSLSHGSTASSPASSPSKDIGGSSIPFISSNPAVPLPSDEVDSATIMPLPTTASHATSQGVQLMGFLAVLILCIELSS
ncbi:hypothetical protein Nepgr_024106 [Nepenthes gracilis]|uniref:Phytocyanin domain-containing protein n=1 Tax=Nepenthes gracilis TaxID=150966 RepID=A0AAD3T258_NEPGR|nr:hypothetical protein Nepgr_024106 [Nepenthes gracilis]